VGKIQSNCLKSASEFGPLTAAFAFAGELLIVQFVAVTLDVSPLARRLVIVDKVFFSLAFCTTLLLLAIFRPLVVHHSQRFRSLIRPERAKPTA
jgi:hypothetical protein